MGAENIGQKEDTPLEVARARFSNVLKRHSELHERASRDSDKKVYERLMREFNAAKASQNAEILLDGEQWNDGLLATIRERVHMEADRKAMQNDIMPPGPHFQDNVTYRVGNKLICCLEGARIGIQYETSFAGESCELYYCVLESKSFLEKMTVHEHTLPFFLPIREAESDFLSSNSMRFIDHVGDLLQAYVDRREQFRLLNELFGDQLDEVYHSFPFDVVEFALNKSNCKTVVSIRYADLVSILPTRVRVLAWPMLKQKNNGSAEDGKEIQGSGTVTSSIHLTYAEEALQTMSLPEAYAELVLNLPEALQQVSQQSEPMSA